MEIILRQDVDGLGFEGDIVKVARGYARNFLIPKGMALEATPKNLKSLELIRKKIESRKIKAREEAEKLKERLEDTVLAFTQKAGEEGKLYGSVTSMDIASELEKQGLMIDRRKIELPRPIKTLGDFEVPVKVYPEVTAVLKVVVNPEKQTEESA